MTNYKINGFISIIKDNYNAARSLSVQNPKVCAGAIRTALETAVRLFWLKRYDEEPVWDMNGREGFSLFMATTDPKFVYCFNDIVVSDVHVIRKMCNDVLHSEAPFTVGDAQELFNRLEKCVEAIQSVIEMDVITSSDNTSKECYVKDDSSFFEKPKPTIVLTTTDTDSERELFWKMLERALDENGNPFSFVSRTHYASINRKKATNNLCLGVDFLIRKQFLRIGIYIADDTITPHYNRLVLHKEEIEEKLGFSPIWNDIGDRNPNTRRIELQLPFIPYDRDDYERLIDDALPIIAKYIEVFSAYLPEAFKDDNKTSEQRASGIRSSLIRDIHKGYGRAAQAIYDDCCRAWNWDASKRYLFGRQQLLYSTQATPEGDSVWFLVHNNWTETKGGKWYNKIQGDTIEEMWLSEKDGLQDKTTRVTFAKTKSNEYVFIGIYAPAKLEKRVITSDIVASNQGIIARAGDSVWIKTYRLVSDKYPR